MKQRPIIFSALMVRALLDGRKTQTRRIIKPQSDSRSTRVSVDDKGGSWMATGPSVTGGTAQWDPWRRLAFAVGDRLWVRESAWVPPHRDEIPEWQLRDGADTWSPDYLADGIVLSDKDQYREWGWKLRPSIHMPRWVSRLTLIVTDVRVQRLQEISEEDAIAEGAVARPFPGPWWQGYRDINGELLHQQTVGEAPPDWMIEPKPMPSVKHLDRSARDGFRLIWTSINGPDAWDANPWVVALTFTVHRCNIDDLPAQGEAA